jgi:hypothetical protein
MQYDLRMLLDIFPDAVSYYNDWDNKVNLSTIELFVQEVRENKEIFSERHYEFIEDKEHRYWPFSAYWHFPRLKQQAFQLIDSALKLRINNPEECLKILLDKIKNIAIVSAILRFVDPHNFGILSPPVEKVLEVKRGVDDIKRYMNYLLNLHHIKEHYKFARIADVDMALYVYALLGEAKVRKWADQKYIDIRKHHEERTSFIKQIRARNLFSGIWNPNRLHMAELLLGTDFYAAGIFAGVTLEIYLRKFANHYNIDTTYTDNYSNKPRIKDARRLINDLHNNGRIDWKEKKEMHNAWETRCRCVHGERESFENVNNLVKLTNTFYNKICAVGVII